VEEVEAIIADLRALLDETQPMASDAEKCAAETMFLRIQHRNRQLGVTANG
jgi:hypothetical protein